MPKVLTGFLAALAVIFLCGAVTEPWVTFVTGSPAVSSVTGTDVIADIQSGATKKATAAQISTYINANLPGVIGSAINITSPAYGASTSGTSAANTTAIQAAINAAVAAHVPLYIPAAASCYNYTAPLTISGNLTVVGDAVGVNSSNGINVPLGSPPLTGSVLCPSSNGSDGIDITGTSLDVQFQNIGLQFQTVFVGTGDGIHYVPTATQGLTNAQWNNVIIFGSDAGHYGVSLGNFIYDVFSQVVVYGGGGFSLTGNGISGNYGDSEFFALQAWTLVGGTNGGVSIASSALNALNFLTFYSPQVMLVNQVGVTPSGNLPTSAQLEWSIDTNTTNVWMYKPATSGNISGRKSLLNATGNSTYDFSSGFWDSVITSPAWITNGVALPSGNPLAVTDTSSSGTVTNIAGSAAAKLTLNASAATTYTHAEELYLPACPTAGTNVTITGCHSLYAVGEIFTAADISAQTGAFLNGAVQLNKSSSTNATEVGDGTTTGNVTIGGGSNQILVGSGLSATSTARAVNVGTASDTVAAGKQSTYESANTAAGAFAVTLAAPKADGERRRVCFKNVTGVITWGVTSPATATDGLPTTMTAGQCQELVYNSVSGTPTNAPATTWIPY